MENTYSRKFSLKALSVTLAAFIVFTIFGVFGVTPTQAATSWPTVNENNYIAFVAQWQLTPYTTASRTQVGTASPYRAYSSARIDPGDECWIIGFSGNSLYVSYPTPSGRRKAWVYKYSVFYCDRPYERVTAKTSIKTYRFNVYNRWGSVYRGDTVWYLGWCEGGTHILYPARDGKQAYKAAYVYNNDYLKQVN